MTDKILFIVKKAFLKTTYFNLLNFSIKIEWSKSSNTQFDYFVIERSKKGKYFKPIMKIQSGKENTTYFEIDYHPPKKISFYRIKQVKTDGSYQYTETVMVKNFNTKNKTKLLKNYNQKEVLLVLKNKKGEEFYIKTNVYFAKKQLFAIDNQAKLEPDFYTIISSSDDILVNREVQIIENEMMVDTF